MPIYAYRCEACGFAKDVLQKLSDPQLTECPHCSQSTFKKQLTAAGFQLKGTGWYVTDFRGGAAPGAAPAATADAKTGDSGAKTAAPSAAPAAPVAAPAPAAASSAAATPGASAGKA